MTSSNVLISDIPVFLPAPQCSGFGPRTQPIFKLNVDFFS
jgi:hypothetical protein